MFEDDDVVAGLGLVAERIAAVSRDAVDAVVHWEQVGSWVQAQQLVATAAVADEAPAWVTTERGRAELSDVQVAGAELAPALRLARVTAQHRVHFAIRVTDRLLDSLAALEAGAITMPKLKAIEEATAVLSPELAHKVETTILPLAADKTPGELRAALAKAVIRVDPAAAEKRRRVAVGDRKVTTVRLPDGVSGLWAVMAAEKTAVAYAAIDSIARMAKSPEDGRGMDALRADTLYDLIANAHDQLVGTTADAAQSDLSTPSTDTRRPPRRSTRLYSVQVTVPAETLTGEGDEPGDLAGYGPITSEAARDLAADDATWRRILFDATTGAVVDVGCDSYRPPAGLARRVLARYRTCRHPGCRQPAHRCDLDHTTRYPDGPTAHSDMAPLCRFHHRLKHHTRWKVAMDSAGVMTWSSATRRAYVSHPWDCRTSTCLAEPPEEHITEGDLDATADAVVLREGLSHDRCFRRC